MVNERGKYVEVQGNNDRENANVAVGNKNGGLYQQWEVVYADELVIEYTKGQLNPDFGLFVEREFSVLTKLRSNRYMDVINNSVVIKTRNGYDSQKWYFDQKTKTVKSVQHKNKSWNIHNQGQQQDLTIHKTSGQWFQLFRYESEFFINSRGLVLTVEGNRDAEGANVITQKRTNGRNQKWQVLYSDKENDVKEKGRDNAWGLYVNRPFYVFSRGYPGKGIEVVGDRNLALRKFVRNNEAQQFYLDSQTKTIKSQTNKDASWDIENAGQSKNLQIWKTNARWFQLFRYQSAKFVNEKGWVVFAAKNDNVQVTKDENSNYVKWDIKYVD